MLSYITRRFDVDFELIAVDQSKSIFFLAPVIVASEKRRLLSKVGNQSFQPSSLVAAT